MTKVIAAVLAALVVLAGCEREKRSFETPQPQSTSTESGARLSTNQPAAPLGGGVRLATGETGPYEGNAFAVNQGKRLYRWYNCNGCHAGGGGGIGPPLMDADWKYGASPPQIFQSIVQGRPNGMPSFGGHIPDDQVWQIVAYVRSMSGQLRKDVAPSRSDGMSQGEAENARDRLAPRPDKTPPDQPTGGPQK
jgi:cytochrome c oxidase cbb3-type subunit III